MFKVAQIGAFDFENYGDVLFVDVLERHLKARLGEGEVTPFSPKGDVELASGKRVLPISSLAAAHEKRGFDAFVIGGGDLVHFQKILTHVHGKGVGLSEYEVLYMWVVPTLLAWKYGVPLLWNAPGVPLEFESNQRDMARYLVRAADYVSVRDGRAKETLCNAGLLPDEVRVVPDSVLSVGNLFLLKDLEEVLCNTGLELVSRQFVFFQCNATFTPEELRVCAEELMRLKQRHGWEVLLQPIGYGLEDQKKLEELQYIAPGEFVMAHRKLNPYEILALLAHCGCYIGSSLHGCITACAYGRPAVVINKNHFNKTEGLVEMLQIERSRIFDVKDLGEVLGHLDELDASVPDTVLAQINKHFDCIADYVGGRVSTGLPARPLDVEIADYIFSMGELEREYLRRCESYNQVCEDRDFFKRENENAAAIVEGLQAEIARLKGENAAVISSKAWKIAKTIGKIRDLFA